VVLDYLPHDDDGLRSASGDAWLGFAVDDVRRFATEAGLSPVADVPIPAAFHPQGPDATLTWHAWVAVKPKS
jgi:hypothetical protein